MLEELGIKNIEYLPAHVVDKRTGELLNYKVANVLDRINALDIEKSDLIYDPEGTLAGVQKMVFDENKLKGHNIFVLGESVLNIVVSKYVREAIETAGLSGFLFVADDEYEPGMI